MLARRLLCQELGRSEIHFKFLFVSYFYRSAEQRKRLVELLKSQVEAKP